MRNAVLGAAAVGHFLRGSLEAPPPRAKRRQLLALLKERGHDVFVESGTYLGDTVAFFSPHVRRIISVELDAELAAQAQARFSDEAHVTIVHGDAIDEIPKAVVAVGDPCLLWLDGHYSGEGTARSVEDEPALQILQRLGRIESLPGTTIVVDDLRLFGLDPGFPTLVDLLAVAARSFPAAQMRTGLDSLVIEI